MFYQVTDNIAADCAAYDRWLADNEVPAATCTECGADGKHFGVNILYRVGDDELCEDCLKKLYTDEMGFKMAERYYIDFARYAYPESDIDGGLALDIWVRILKPNILSEMKTKELLLPEYKLTFPTLQLLREFTFEDEDAFCECLNKNI